MVKVWKEQINIPTYEVGKPEKNPIFLEKRVYQGSSGVVYPYPVIESIADEKTDHTYEAVFMENQYIKVMILPELGGRVQMAYDKIKQRHFIYYNNVIKPALVGLAGPWISGGIEFNWPQHHRPSTFMPVDYKIEENMEEGSVTVWINERERMFHQQGQAGFTLRSGCAYLEIQGRLYNPTETPQTFLWWANPAVAVNDAYQSVFPPDVNAVFDHGKRAVSTFPIATGTYYKMDYSAGVDISNYKNIFVPTSYMVAKSKYNFEGGYENDTQAGMLHVADHHVAPGKKQWTWGNGDFGRAWDRNLTDEDGPYIELMAGVFTENQPDFSWLMPYEEKTFVQYFMPYRELGIVKNANKDILMNITEIEETDKAVLQVFATSAHRIEIKVYSDSGAELYKDYARVWPENIFKCEIDLHGTPFSEISVSISGTTRLYWHAETDKVKPIPDAAEAALRPEEIKTTEQLFLTGLHLEQYRHATWSALDYYEEALRRDPIDVRCNNAMGLWYLRRGRLDKAEPYFRVAVKVLQKRNLNPYDGEPIYNLALCLKLQAMLEGINTPKGSAKLEEAYDWAYKSTWNAAWQQAGFMMCAQISFMQNHLRDALNEVDKSLIYGWHNHKARALKTEILGCYLSFERVSNLSEQQRFIAESLAINPFNYACIINKRNEPDGLFHQYNHEAYELMHNDVNNYHEVALDCLASGIWWMAASFLKHAIKIDIATPMTYYYLSYAECCENGKYVMNDTLAEAARQSTDYCFPNRIEDVIVLTEALRLNPDDANAAYLLGNFYYDKRQYDKALEYWTQSAKIAPSYPTVHRNLALLYYNKQHDADRALEEMETAFALDQSDSRIFMELDQLYKKLECPYEDRLMRYESIPEIIAQRDDLILEHATLLNQLGRYEEAKNIIDTHIFHPWEGGEGKVSGQYQLSRLEMAKALIKKSIVPASNDADPSALHRAIALLNECLTFPHNLGEGKLYGAQDNDFYYYLGNAHHLLGDEETAREMWQKGTIGPTEPAAALYYNDAKPEKIYFAALCYRALGEEAKARGLFFKLINYGKQHYFDEIRMDYFAVSLPDLLVWDEDLNIRNRRHCENMIALGKKGLKL